MPDASQAFDPFSTFVQLTNAAEALPIAGGDAFWRRVVRGRGGRRLEDGRLLFAYRFERDLAHWESHPGGDEFVWVLSGSIDFVLEEPGGERVVRLDRGAAFIVPRGVWHRQVVREPGDVLFVTAGKGTRHRPL